LNPVQEGGRHCRTRRKGGIIKVWLNTMEERGGYTTSMPDHVGRGEETHFRNKKATETKGETATLLHPPSRLRKEVVSRLSRKPDNQG